MNNFAEHIRQKRTDLLKKETMKDKNINISSLK